MSLSSALTNAMAQGVVVVTPTVGGPKGLDKPLETLMGWLVWGGVVAGIAGLIICGVMMIMGRRGKSQTAVEGAIGIPWVIGGIAMVLLAPAIVRAVVGVIEN